MRRAQSSIEVVFATTLLCLLLSTSGLAALTAWRSAERSMGRIAALRAATRGGDPATAAAAVMPRLAPAGPRAPHGTAR